MTMPSPYPTACRECRKTEGWPVRAQTQVHCAAIRVDVRCRACGHHWTDELLESQTREASLDGSGGPWLVQRKPDRRKGVV